MKEWIKKLTGEEMAEIYRWGHLWDDVDTTKEFDQKIFKMIDEYDAKRRQKKKKSVRNKFLLTAIIATLLLIPVLFIINNLQGKDDLFLAKTENHVIFRVQNKAIQFKPGDSINENTLIQTGANSTCEIKYGKKGHLSESSLQFLKV